MKRLSTILALTLVMFLWTSFAFAQGGYDLLWWVMAGGGETSSSGQYTLVGTIGQPNAGALMNSDNYSLTGGFWDAAGLSDNGEESLIYLPIIFK